jgi:hypothetical protein
MLLSQYKFGNRERTNERVLFTKAEKTISRITAISLIVCTVNGSNPLTTERFFFVGLVNILVASFFPLFIMQLSFQIYIRTWRFNSDTSYSESLKDAFDGKGGTIIRIMLIFTLFNDICYHSFDIYKYSSIITRYFWPGNELINNRYLHIYLLVAISIIPTFFMERFTKLAIPSYIANLSVIIIHIIMVVFTYNSVQKTGFNPNGKTTLYSSDIINSINCLSYFILIYNTFPVLCNIGPELSVQKQGEITRIALASNFSSWALNFIGGYIGYFYFFGSSNGAISIYLYSDSLVKVIAAFLGLLNILITNVCLNYLNGIEIVKLFTPRGYKIDSPWIGVIASSSFGIANAIGPMVIMDILTSICQLFFLIVCVIVPPVAFIKMYGVKNFWGIMCILLIICVTIVGIATVYAVFTRTSSRD